MNKVTNENKCNTSLKYLTRRYYYGKLLDYEFVSEAMILKFACYTLSEYFGGTTIIRIYVPTALEQRLQDVLRINSNYFIVAAPYRINYNKQYRHRVDMLINIFEEIF